MSVDKGPKYITRIDQLTQLSPAERESLKPVADRYATRLNEYYQSLINWNDPNDPIRRIVIPDLQEMEDFGEWDASNEASFTVVKGLEHKYSDTALLLVNSICGAYCRFCFRKRLFTNDNDEVSPDITDGVCYIRKHPEINNVLLSGGDPLVMPTVKLEKIIRSLREIDHVRIIRIGSKMPAFNPFRIINDPSLIEMLGHYSRPDYKIYLMAHFNHPRELTKPAIQSLQLLQKAGVTLMNQTPMIRGINDDAQVLGQLLNWLSSNGVVPYYMFLCRPTIGNKSFIVPIEEALDIFERARRNLSGLAKQVRLCMSHETGKIEVLGMTSTQIILRYHRAVDPDKIGRLMTFNRNPKALWFDDYECRTEPESMVSMRISED